MTSKIPHIMFIMVALIKYEVIMNHATRRDISIMGEVVFHLYIADAGEFFLNRTMYREAPRTLTQR